MSILYRIDDETFKDYVKSSKTVSDVCRKCNVMIQNPHGVKKRIQELSIDISHFTPKKTITRFSNAEKLNKIDNETFKKYVNSSKAISQICEKCGIDKNSKKNRDSVKERIKKLNVPTSHIVGRRMPTGRKKRPLEDILVKRDKPLSSSHSYLRKRMVEEGLIEEKCYVCDLKYWMGKKIPLELDHINGDRTDNRKENLRSICPNCHAQTDTYKGKNIKQSLVPIKIENKCQCGEIIDKKAASCRSCSLLKRRKVANRPTREEFQEMKKTMTMVEIGKKYGVSCNTIRKWFK